MYDYDDNPNIDRWHEEESYYGFNKMIGNARIKSTKKNIKISYKGETIKLSKRKLKKFFVKAAISIVSLSIAGNLLWKIGDATVEKVDYFMDVISVRNEESKEIEQLLVSNDLNIEPTDTGDWCNDYSTVESLSKDDIYGFYYYCGYDETEKVLQALGYTSWDNFLMREGYFNNNGSPSLEVWENYAEAKLVTEQREAENVRKH